MINNAAHRIGSAPSQDGVDRMDVVSSQDDTTTEDSCLSMQLTELVLHHHKMMQMEWVLYHHKLIRRQKTVAYQMRSSFQ